jgi:hypothetical protein
MKTLRNILALLLIVAAGLNSADAQTTKKDKKAAKEAAIKKNIDERHYTFMANYVLPQRGGARQLTSEYDLRVTKDSVISFLPYFGRAYFDVPYNATDGGIKFTSTKFDYKVTDKKKGGWEITIKPTDVKNLNSLILYISTDGYASLSVSSSNRDYITFDGFLK